MRPENHLPLQMQMATSKHDAPGWRMVDRHDFYTCVPPAQGPFVQPEALAFVHSFDPGVIPLWRKQRMLPPGTNAKKDIVTVSHIIIGRHVRDPLGPKQLFYVEMPFNADFPRPNYLDFPMTVKNTWDGGPDGIIPFDMAGARVLWEKHLDDMTSVMEAMLAKEQRDHEDLEETRRKVAEDLEDRRQRLEKTLQPLLDKMTPRDWAEQFMAYHGRRKPPRTYVFHGRSG
jgi:hypothetical protein